MSFYVTCLPIKQGSYIVRLYDKPILIDVLAGGYSHTCILEDMGNNVAEVRGLTVRPTLEMARLLREAAKYAGFSYIEYQRYDDDRERQRVRRKL